MISKAFEDAVKSYDRSESEITKLPTAEYLLQKALPDVPGFNKKYEVALSSFSSKGIGFN